MRRRLRLHLLLPPLGMPIPPKYATDPAALRAASDLYDQLIDKGYSEEEADRLSKIARLNGGPA